MPGDTGIWELRDAEAAQARMHWLGSVMLSSLLGLAAAGCSSPFAASTDDPNSPVTMEYLRQFKDIDKSNRGVIKLDEALEHYTRKFAELDLNHDGFLDAREIEPMLPVLQASTAPDLVRALDNNSDGKVSLGEFHIIANWLFARARGTDGSMSVADTHRAQDRPQDRRLSAPPENSGMPDRGGPPAGRI